MLDKFVHYHRQEIKLIAEQLKDFKIKGIPIRYEEATKAIIRWLNNFIEFGFTDLKLPLKLLQSIQFIKTETLIHKLAELVEPYLSDKEVYIAALGESSESSHRIASNFNQYENYFPDISSLLNNIPQGVSGKIILIDDFLNSGGQLINILYGLLNQPLPEGEPNDEFEYRTKLDQRQIQKLKRSSIVLIYYLAFDEGIEKIIKRCKEELGLDITIKRYIATNKNESAFGDPIEQVNIKKGLRSNVFSSSSAFVGHKTESLTVFYNFLINIGKKLNKANKPNWSYEKINNRALGYSNLGRLIVTDYNIPTISITALWQSGLIERKPHQEAYWHSFLPRREKKFEQGNEKPEILTNESNEEIAEQRENPILDDTKIINERNLLNEIEKLQHTSEEQDAEIDDRDLKGYGEIYQILRLFRPNAKLKEFANREIKSKKIGYVIFQIEDDVHKRVNNYIYLFQGIHLKPTFEHIKLNYPEILNLPKNNIILLPKEKAQVQIEKRLNSVMNLFRPLSVYYLDDFIRNNCTPSDYFQSGQSKFLETKNFIHPTIKSEYYAEKHLESVEEWISSEDEPILVVKGVGGVGKTTLTEYIADLFLKSNSSSKVIFIDTHELIEELLKREKFHEDIDLYSIYEADFSVNSSRQSKLSVDQFRINLDIGNLLVVIDGLDEVISRISKFDVDKFLESIIRYTDDSGNGKVLISCRSHFWQVSKYTPSQITSIEILPFDTLQARLFFEKCFNKNIKKVRKAFELATKMQDLNTTAENTTISETLEIIDSKSKIYYHPYVLDIIKNLIETESDITSAVVSLESKILEKSVKYDLIIYEVCYRETNRIIKGLEIDQQIKFFMELAVDHKGQIPVAQFENLVYTSVGTWVDSTYVEAFKSHPFLFVGNNNVKFRYDFFKEYFKSIYISNYIKFDSDYKIVDNDFINILVEDCWYNSGTVNDTKARIKEWLEEDDLKIIDLISQLKSLSDLEPTIVRRAVCHLFYICLTIHHKKGLNEITDNTNLLKLLFESRKGIISGLYIINFYSKKDNIRFDFRGLIFKDCFIDNFESFWLCPADSTTYFKNSTLLNLNFEEVIKSNIPRGNFQDCTFNEEIDEFYRERQIAHGDNLNLKIRYELNSLFRLFLVRGRLERQPFSFVLETLQSNVQPLFHSEPLIVALTTTEVFNSYDEFGEKQLKITDAFKEDIKSLIRNGMMTRKLSNLVVHLKKMPELFI